MIAALAVPLLPLFAGIVTGVVSRYLPAWMFSDAGSGKDDVVVAGVAATLLLATLAAACVFGAAKAGWRAARGEAMTIAMAHARIVAARARRSFFSCTIVV